MDYLTLWFEHMTYLPSVFSMNLSFANIGCYTACLCFAKYKVLYKCMT